MGAFARTSSPACSVVFLTEQVEDLGGAVVTCLGLEREARKVERKEAAPVTCCSLAGQTHPLILMASGSGAMGHDPRKGHSLSKLGASLCLPSPTLSFIYSANVY